MSANEKIEAEIVKVGKTYRIILLYNEEKYVLLRFRVSRDSSFYLFDIPASQIRYGKANIKAGTSTTIDYTKGELIEDQSKLSMHHSHHGSGYVKTSSGNFKGSSLKSLKKSSQLLMIIFPHPSKLQKVNNLRKSDWWVKYPIDENCPLCLDITAAPKSKAGKLVLEASFRWSYAFIYEDLLENDDLVLIFTFYHSPGAWPKAKIELHPISQ